MAGLFITFEGVEGCGKTTQINLLENWLLKRRRFPLKTHEPGGTPVGDRLRTLLLDPELKGMAPISEALLYVASRAQIVNDVIRPGLEALQFLLQGVPGGEHQHRCALASIFTKFAAHIQTIHARHLYIHQNHVGMSRLDLLDGGLSVTRLSNH